MWRRNQVTIYLNFMLEDRSTMKIKFKFILRSFHCAVNVEIIHLCLWRTCKVFSALIIVNENVSYSFLKLINNCEARRNSSALGSSYENLSSFVLKLNAS